MLPRFSLPAILLTISLSLSFFCNLPAKARWAEKKEAHVEYVSGKTTYKVKKDGTWVKEVEVQLKVLTEAGRQSLSTQTYTYDATRSTFEVLEAKTNNNGIESIVCKEKIEDKPLASDPLGLKDTHQVLVPFECVTVGSIISLKIKETCFKPPFAGYFASHFVFSNYLWSKDQTIVESEMALFYNINDPRDNLQVTQTYNPKKKGPFKHVIHISFKKPIFEDLTNESCHSYVEPSLFTSVSLSTETDYKRIGKLEAQFYQPSLTEPLPKKLEEMYQAVRNVKNEIDCMNTVVRSLIGNISYLGNWNIAEGHLAPRSLAQIVQTGCGDCKEYAVCLASILNKLGYKARVAAVFRGDAHVEWATIPNHSEFNHAIVKVITPSGKTYWVDPTNIVAMADGIFPDIADRPVLVLDPENPTYERVPPIDPAHATSHLERVVTIKEGGNIHTEGAFHFAGEASKGFTELLSLHPLSMVKEIVIKSLSNNNDPKNGALTLSEEVSSIVKPLKGNFSYEEDSIMIHTNFGDAFPLAGNWYKPYIAVSQQDEGALHVGHPQTIIKKILLKGISAEHLNKLAFSLETPWLNVKREIVLTEEGVLVTEIIEQLKTIIPAKDLKSDEYRKLKETLRKYCDGAAIIFSSRQ